MAVITGWLTEQTLGGLTDNPNLSDEFWDYEYVAQFNPSPYANVSPSSLIGVPVNNLPVEANGKPIAGFVASSFFDQWYNTIHVSPQSLDLGNIVSVQTQNVYVWNAYFEPRTLGSIEGLEEGLELDGQPVPPLMFTPLQERVWTVSISTLGASVLNALIAFVFDNGTEPGLRITGRRIVAWLPRPDWSEGVIERLEWLTDVLQSESMVEQRRALRTAPRRAFEADFIAEGRERQALDVALHGWSDRAWALPIWPDIQLLEQAVAAGAQYIPCETAHLDFTVGGLLMLRDESALGFEVAEISAINALGVSIARPLQKSWPMGTRLYPARTARLSEQPSLTRLTDRLSQLSARFLVLEACDWPEALPSTLYRSRPVYDTRPDETQDLSYGVQRNLLELDSTLAIPALLDAANLALTVQAHRWLEAGRAERSWLRSLLYALRGQQTAVWIPTHADDLTLAAPIAAGSASIDVQNIGYARYAKGRTGRKDIRIELWNGSVLHHRVLDAFELTDEVERLELDSAPGAIATTDVLRISYLALCRLESDSTELEHMTDSQGVAACSLTFRGVRDDEF